MTRSKAGERAPIVWIALGRQRVGKTALLNSAVQFFREAGNAVRVWNADQLNRSHSLSQFFPDAETVPEGGLGDAKNWIEKRFFDLIAHRYDAVLDVGGGTTGFSRLIEEVPVLDLADQAGIRIVGVFCTGPERADLDYLEQFAQQETFLPASTVIAFNAGLVVSEQSANGAFEPVRSHRAVLRALAQGARAEVFPSLSCMAQVTDRGLTFREAMDGATRQVGDTPLGLFDRARVNRWWSRDIPAFFAKLPPEWLPLPSRSAQIRQPAEAS